MIHHNKKSRSSGDEGVGGGMVGRAVDPAPDNIQYVNLSVFMRVLEGRLLRMRNIAPTITHPQQDRWAGGRDAM